VVVLESGSHRTVAPQFWQRNPEAGAFASLSFLADRRSAPHAGQKASAASTGAEHLGQGAACGDLCSPSTIPPTTGEDDVVNHHLHEPHARIAKPFL
jgi:hypothetical protein